MLLRHDEDILPLVSYVLTGPRAKLDWGQEHLKSLNTEIRRFLNKDPYRVTRQGDADIGQYQWTVRIAKQPQLRRWGLMAGDCVHNLRSALDHTTWTLAGSDPADNITQFPIFDDPDTFQSKGKWRVKRLRPSESALVEWLQPYRRSHGAVDLLALLANLDNIDKHRAIQVVSSVMRESKIEFRRPADRSGQRKLIRIRHHHNVAYGPFADGDIIADALVVSPKTGMRVKGEFTFDIALGEGTPAPVQPPVGVALAGMAGCVDKIIGLFERLRQKA